MQKKSQEKWINELKQKFKQKDKKTKRQKDVTFLAVSGCELSFIISWVVSSPFCVWVDHLRVKSAD